MSKLIIPTPLRKFTNGASEIDINGTDVQSAIEGLIQEYPALSPHLLDESGAIRSFIRIFVGDEDIQSLDGAQTKITQEETLSIIPAIAGGV